MITAKQILQWGTAVQGDPQLIPIEKAEATTNERLNLRIAWDTIMVQQTLDYAQRSVPFYREQAAAKAAPEACAFEKLSDLGMCPILQKKDVEAAPFRFISETAPPQYTRCTSGTTARRLTVYGNEEEAELQQSLLLLRSSNSTAEKISGQRPRRICMRLLPALRRVFQNSTASQNVVNIELRYVSEEHLGLRFDYTDHFIQMLWEEYLFPETSGRISIIHATPPFLFELISDRVARRGVRASETAVRDVVLTGGMVTARNRATVSQVWAAETHTAYSCTEVWGSSPECAHDPTVYHAGPGLYVEVVDPVTSCPVEPGGHGVVLLTSFYPFQQVMPFVRYWTGDVAERCVVPCSCGAVGTSFRPLGRLVHCLDLTTVVGRRAYIGTRHVLDAVAKFETIPQIPYPRYTLTLRPVNGGHEALLSVEVTNVAAFASQKIEEQLVAVLAEKLGQFVGDAVRDGRLTLGVHLVGKGDLPQFLSLYPDR
jgi:phenylacetate-coenzyme A ligase PaaK-like adenylate-forming protein